MKHSTLIVATLAGLFSFGAMASTPAAPSTPATHSGVTAKKASGDAHTVKYNANAKSEKGKKTQKTK